MYFLIAGLATVATGFVGYHSLLGMGVPSYESSWFGSLLAMLAMVVLYPDPDQHWEDRP